MIKGDHSEVLALAVELEGAGFKAGLAARTVVQQAGDMFVDTWASIARGTAGEHGIHYPDSIEADMVFDLGGASVEVGPNPGMPQGGMSFEHGSRNQPPHLDGLYALDEVEGPFGDRLGEVMDGILP